jgi:hypothetical protein
VRCHTLEPKREVEGRQRLISKKGGSGHHCIGWRQIQARQRAGVIQCRRVSRCDKHPDGTAEETSTGPNVKIVERAAIPDLKRGFKAIAFVDQSREDILRSSVIRA